MFSKVIYFFYLTLFSLSSAEEPKDVYVLALLPMTGTVWPGGKAILMVANMALEFINNRSDILEGYNLKLIVTDTKVSVQLMLFQT